MKILALGADIKNQFILASNGKLKLGPELGDLSVGENYARFKQALKGVKVDMAVCDLHPGYFSTQYTQNFKRIRHIQHHHAHIASVAYEHKLKKPVIGVSFDGTGYGTDGNIWGGEFLLVKNKAFKRIAHLGYHQMPGGDKVITEPWRMVLGILGKRAFGYIKKAKKADQELVLTMLAKDLNSPLTSSVGRLFDACAALLGIAQVAKYEAEGPIKLEKLCNQKVKESYNFVIRKNEDYYIIDTNQIFEEILEDLKKKVSKNTIATKFHNSIAQIIIKMCKKLSKELKIKDICLSGGVFQNKFLLNKVIKGIKASKLNVYYNQITPINDYNIALGQLLCV